jgi:hypothetical protein
VSPRRARWPLRRLCNPCNLGNTSAVAGYLEISTDILAGIIVARVVSPGRSFESRSFSTSPDNLKTNRFYQLSSDITACTATQSMRRFGSCENDTVNQPPIFLMPAVDLQQLRFAVAAERLELARHMFSVAKSVLRANAQKLRFCAVTTGTSRN